MKLFEKQLLAVLYEGLRLTMPTGVEAVQVKQSDNDLLATEARDLMGDTSDWQLWKDPDIRLLKEKIVPLAPREAKELFLGKFEEYTQPAGEKESKNVGQ